LDKFTAEINPEPSKISHYMTQQWSATAAHGLPELLDLLRTV